MVKKTEKKDVISIEDALKTNILVTQALLDLLVSKNIITQEELLAKIREIKMSKEAALGKMK